MDNNLINIRDENGQMVVSSREVAENFGKRHTDVLESIRTLSKGCAEKSADLFFETKWQNTQNKQWYSEYLMTRDGFSLLVMGFTGKEALEWKLKYIEAFNMMEEKIKNNIAGFIVPQTMPEALRLAADLYEQNEDLKLLNESKTKKIAELEPKARYVDIVLQSKALVATSQIAKDYGMSAQKFNHLLHVLKIQYKTNGQWLLYAAYQDKGYVGSETISFNRKDGSPDTKMNTKWTQKGRLFLYDKLKEKNILPVMEQDIKAVM